MNIYKLEEIKKIYTNEDIKRLLGYAMFNPTEGRIKSAAEGIYAKEQGRFYVAEQEGIIGIIGVRRVDNDFVEIMHIAVDEDHRKSGVATAMIRFVDEMERVDRIIAETDGDAVDFYRSFGFDVQEKEDDLTGYVRYTCTYHCR